MHGNYINGQWTMARGGRTLPNRNPAHIDMILGEFPDSTAADIADAVVAANEAFPAWRTLPLVQRGEILYRAAEILQRRTHLVAEAITREQGKALRESLREVASAIGALRYFAGESRRPAGEVYPPFAPGLLLYTRRDPLGAVGVITPWTFPLSIAVWKVAPALVYGNTVVLKPAELTPLSAEILASILHEAGLPAGVFNLVQGRGDVVGTALVGHQQIAAISFTGSSTVGYAIQRRLVERDARVELELGGKNPMIVLRDADIDRAVRWTANGAMRLSGQHCTATSRVIVEEPVLSEFSEKLVGSVQSLVVGDGMEPDTFVGPVISEAQQARVLDYVHIGLGEGAEVWTGGDALENDGYAEGYYVAPTVFGNVQPGMRIMQEEIFGPVIGIVAARNIDHAIDIANNVPSRCGASIATRDLDAVMHYVDAIAATAVHVNRDSSAGDLQIPIGGMRSSSSPWRELGQAARDFFTNTRTIFLQRPAEE